ncbi:atlastin-2-like [Panonychus citri]|uniref:atlastin-2-like n=1 Tax=Panonychus citri TaxID=50023 RepID=UPI002307727F|nr:atlastin-2-like [Panonychus citri]
MNLWKKVSKIYLWQLYPLMVIREQAFHGDLESIEIRGIVLWSKPLIIKRRDGTKIVVLLMDTQGFSSESIEEEQFFAISNLISSTLIYNQSRNIQSKDISNLCKFSECLPQESRVPGDQIVQKLLILVRDWAYVSDYNYGNEGGRKFLNYKRTVQMSKLESSWRSLDQCYSDMDCFLLPSPGENVDDIHFDGRISKIRPDFVGYLKELVISLLSPENIVIKSWEGEEQKLWQVSNRFSLLAKQLNDHNKIDVEKLFISHEETSAENALKKLEFSSSMIL